MTARSVFIRRLALLKDGLRKAGLDAILITNGTNVSYISGFQGHDSMALITLDKNYFITDSRYIEEAEGCLAGFCVNLVDASTYCTVSGIIADHRLKRIGFEAMDLPYGVAARISRLIKIAKIVPCKDMVEAIRSIKDTEEISLIRDAVRLNKTVLENAVLLVKAGISEKAIASAIEIGYIDRGARPAFEPMVASGENASKPHSIPTDAKITDNSFVMIDIGARLNGYCSDVTRMVTIGRVKEKFKKIYDVVSVAQEKAIEKIRPGARIRDVDAAGRSYIERKGFGRYFGHSLGHGIGMSVHEKPTVSGLSEGIIARGMVFTVEPAIYIPKFGGVRIEDMVLVTDKGCELLTR